MKTLVVDNETFVVKAIRQLVALYCPMLEVVGDSGSVEETIRRIKSEKIELLLLDIELDDGTGFDILKEIQEHIQVIFITAYDKYAIQAFKYSAVDFILKPIDSDDLVAAVQKAVSQKNSEQQKLKITTLLENMSSNMQNQKLIVSNREAIHALNIGSIAYLKANGAYTEFFIPDKSILTSKNLRSYEDILLNVGFIRIHHTYLVNTHFIDLYDKLECTVKLSTGKNLPVAQRRKEELISALKKLSM